MTMMSVAEKNGHVTENTVVEPFPEYDSGAYDVETVMLPPGGWK